jgi:hypothetical protein
MKSLNRGLGVVGGAVGKVFLFIEELPQLQVRSNIRMSNRVGIAGKILGICQLTIAS